MLVRELSELEPDYIELRVVDSLQKIFMDREPLSCRELRRISALKGEILSFQVAYRYLKPYYSSQMKRQAAKNPAVKVLVHSELSPYTTIRKVVSVPSAYPAYPEYDQGYLTNQPGLFPDVLRPFAESFQIIPFFYRSLWVDIEIPEDAEAGEYPFKIILTDLEGNYLKTVCLDITVVNHVLEKQKLIRTEWFYGDCIADYYHTPVFSERFWKLVSEFMAPMVKRGINMILTPLFTYPLDTLIGNERTTIQLIGVTKKGAKYCFDFTQLEHWIALAREKGFVYFEMSHLFSQWGAKYAPKIMAEVDGVSTQIFGWDTKADSPQYREFLDAFLPLLTVKLNQLGIAGNTYFHISDEPNEGNIGTYKIAKEMVKPYLNDFHIIDALSTLEFYKSGIISQPVPTNEHIGQFLEAGLPDPWLYYCSGEFLEVSNRFFAMPSYRTRILGVQLYLYEIRGFLHWGYNYYNSQYSLRHINPYVITDADDAFPSGDSFLVYPGDDGRPEESIRMMVMAEAMQDMRALAMLEKRKGKAYVRDLIRRYAGMDITFNKYPLTSDFVLDLREAVNQSLAALA